MKQKNYKTIFDTFKLELNTSELISLPYIIEEEIKRKEELIQDENRTKFIRERYQKDLETLNQILTKINKLIGI